MSNIYLFIFSKPHAIGLPKLLKLNLMLFCFTPREMQRWNC